MEAAEMTPAPEEKPSAADLATRDYQMLLPQFQKLMESDDLAGRKLKEVFMALTEYPLDEKGAKFSYTAQQELYLLGQRLFDCKFTIMKTIFEMKSDEIEKLVDGLIKETKKEEVKDESVQG